MKVIRHSKRILATCVILFVMTTSSAFAQGLGEAIGQITRQRYNEIIREGGTPVQDWYGMSQLQEILNRYAEITGARGHFYIIDAPLNVMAQSSDGWNAESLANGALLFNYDLMNASWAVAEGYARWRVDPRFNLNYHFAWIAYSVTHDIGRMPEADPLNRLQRETALIFRDMIAFVAAHELAHFINHDLARKLVEHSRTGGHPVSTAVVSRRLELEADRVGMDILVRTWSYDPRGGLLSLAFMDYLAKYSGKRPTATDSHPPPSIRFSRVEQWLAQNRLPYNLWW